MATEIPFWMAPYQKPIVWRHQGADCHQYLPYLPASEPSTPTDAYIRCEPTPATPSLPPTGVHAVLRPEAGPCATCGSTAVAVMTQHQEPGMVADGDDAVCQNCGATGVYCGAPSDGLGTDWDFYANEPTTPT